MATLDNMGRIILDQQDVQRTNAAMRNIMNVGTPSGPAGAYSTVNPGNYSLLEDRPLSQRIMNTLRAGVPGALKTMRVVPGLGLLATGGLIANALLQDDDLEVAEKNIGWVARALDPTTITTQDNETIRSATSQHSDTGKWIVYPTIRSVDGKLVKLDDVTAKRRTEELGDFVEFDSEQEATEFSKNLSNEIGNRRRVLNRNNNRGLL